MTCLFRSLTRTALSSFGDLAQTIPGTYAWTSFTAPTTPLVPTPYTPVQVNGNAASVWGRTYTFGGSLFLTQVRLAGGEYSQFARHIDRHRERQSS